MRVRNKKLWSKHAIDRPNKIKVEKTKAETERKAVLFGVPMSEPDYLVLELLK